MTWPTRIGLGLLCALGVLLGVLSFVATVREPSQLECSGPYTMCRPDCPPGWGWSCRSDRVPKCICTPPRRGGR